MQQLQGREYGVFDDVLKKAKAKGRIRVAVAQPTDETSLSGVIDSYQEGLIDPILVGDEQKIKKVASELGFDVSSFEIVNAINDLEAATKTAEFATKGEVKALMKGNLHTNDIMGAVVKRDAGLRTERSITHAFIMDIPAYHKALFIADAAINIAPNVDVKMSIIQNTVDLAHKLGISLPKVGILSAVEMPYEKIPSSMEAHELTERSKTEVKDALVYGPLAFDNAISALSAKIKKIDSEVCGDPDILIAPQIESGNILFKALVYLAYAKVAGVVLGAKVPVILTSRADNAEARVASSALAVLASQ
ncbi:bifunctional enoyl-CoA hydratase/phosphate acetyltransferase [Helicobacter kayseriensis]|uniref:bifunctional enoyl-CoA hydratase/phosphate acetyltransferase n=1 Tax=Helicobacter kayseriensis TaxID=2905877 RepID=UPI001E4AE44F|nr:bifunctional enoyl-CoA hydratase/phosphate acetyltransferase [Helicobacter kayseriensis]MCE3046638.1 bifunctional enoyl-CoA hydratase/phosphate acetyltransferase [Helicobacter kayseriensis]MCE3048060.1 bifunctional enoyl-CoA hydratase/phosphate acetyltransferase [Helicobacter kayseriensis]